MAITLCRTHNTYRQHSAATMAPPSTNRTVAYRSASSATTSDPTSVTSHFTATAGSYVATPHANTSSTATNFRDPHTRLPSTTSDADT